jgi:hypothetical protein
MASRSNTNKARP